jgi:hypoxanthine-DNA glycosylase
MELHNIEPVFDENSEVLILGSFPSVKSREQCFFYAHPRNRFWKVIAGLCQAEVPESIGEKKRLLLDNRIALWDVIASCQITGSSDVSISDVRVNDLSVILTHSRVSRIFCNGRKAGELYDKFLYPLTGIKATILPSTSPANAAWSLERLTEAWKTAIRKEK